MKISIVTSYYNRKPQFINTLKTISKSAQIHNVELIVVDDCSAPEHRLEDIPQTFPFVKVIRNEPENKWYVNPCIPFNMAIKQATGDIVVLQNPECLHVGDILSHIVNNVNNTNYITYAVYSIDYQTTMDFFQLPYGHKYIFSIIKDRITPFNNVHYVNEGRNCWYNHSVVRPMAYHFIAAITKENMDKLNGFDERYAHGIGFDDDEILYRIRKMGLDVRICDEPFGIHQWHYSENNFFARVANPAEASHKNHFIFENLTKKMDGVYVN